MLISRTVVLHFCNRLSRQNCDKSFVVFALPTFRVIFNEWDICIDHIAAGAVP